MKKTLLLAALAVFTLSATNSVACDGKEKGKKDKSKKECAKVCAKGDKPACCMKKGEMKEGAVKEEAAPKAN